MKQLEWLCGLRQGGGKMSLSERGSSRLDDPRHHQERSIALLEQLWKMEELFVEF
jgi:hypothetical protein